MTNIALQIFEAGFNAGVSTAGAFVDIDRNQLETMFNATCLPMLVSIDPRHFEILAEALSEVKATSDGLSDQPIADIIAECLAEIKALKEPTT